MYIQIYIYMLKRNTSPSLWKHFKRPTQETHFRKVDTHFLILLICLSKWGNVKSTTFINLFGLASDTTQPRLGPGRLVLGFGRAGAELKERKRNMKPTHPTLRQNNGRYLHDESGQQKTRHNMAANLKRGLSKEETNIQISLWKQSFYRFASYNLFPLEPLAMLMSTERSVHRTWKLNCPRLAHRTSFDKRLLERQSYMYIHLNLYIYIHLSFIC